MRLYEISNEYTNLITELTSEGLQDGEIEESLVKQLDEIKEKFNEKAINVAKFIKNIEAEDRAIKDAIEGMRNRSARLQKQQAWLESYLKENIEKSGLCDVITCPELVIKLVQNPPSVVVYDESLILDAYKRKKEVITIDKVAIKKDITEGFEVDGARIEQKKRLVIQ